MIDKLIALLLEESKQDMPSDFFELSQDNQFRVLCNIRRPMQASTELLALQDKYLQQKTVQRGVVEAAELDYVDSIALWQGDITRLGCSAIVNACNPQLLGCFSPLHNCIDNVIHTFAGLQVRIDCNDIMQGGDLPNGEVRVTSAYNLPSEYILHTVGPVVSNGRPTMQNIKDLTNCYQNSLDKANEMGLETVAFCSISTGVYGYPQKEACRLAVATVKKWLEKNQGVKVIFNVFLDEDRVYYEQELSREN